MTHVSGVLGQKLGYDKYDCHLLRLLHRLIFDLVKG